MNAQKLEEFLALLYVDASVRERFLADPEGEALRFGLEAEAAGRLRLVDREGLRLAAESFERKRRHGDAVTR